MNSRCRGAIASALAAAIAACIQTSSAAAPVPAPAPSSPVAVLSASLTTLMTQERLDPESSLNPFVPSKRWVKPVEAAPVAAARVLPAGDEFKKTHVLSALMSSAHGGLAIVNGRLLKIGDVIDGYKLLSVSQTTATLTGQSSAVELRMPATDNLQVAAPLN